MSISHCCCCCCCWVDDEALLEAEPGFTAVAVFLRSITVVEFDLGRAEPDRELGADLPPDGTGLFEVVPLPLLPFMFVAEEPLDAPFVVVAAAVAVA